MISILFSLTSSSEPISEQEMGFIAKNSIQFHAVNERNGRTLFQATIPDISKVQIFQGAYAARSPIVVGCWNVNGFQYVKHTTDEEGNEITTQPSIKSIYNEEGEQTGEEIINEGEIMYPFNETEYLALQYDKIIPSGDEETPSVVTRYTEPQQMDNFAGWQDKKF